MRHTAIFLTIPLGLALAAPGCGEGDGASAGDGGSGGSGGSGNTLTSPGLAATLLNAKVILPNEGPELVNPARDRTLIINSLPIAEAQPLRPGEPVRVSIPFTAPNGNVVAAGIRFGTTGSIRTVQLPEAEGQTSATLAFDLVIPASVCADLGNVCHQIICYEFAVTEGGLISQDNIMNVTLLCGGCTDSTCAPLLPPGSCRAECDSRSGCDDGMNCQNGQCVVNAVDLPTSGGAGSGNIIGDTYECNRDTSAEEARCQDNSCPSNVTYCNGSVECADGSDEAGCNVDCPELDCGGLAPSWLRCRPGLRCDGVAECSDQSDEAGCSSCSEGVFLCSSGRCLSPSSRCDGIDSCGDGLDEQGCSSCTLGAFLCANQQCVPASLRCDGSNGCGDGSDEQGCSNCTAGAFLCANQQCLSASSRCNGSDNCGDGSDEQDCVTCVSGFHHCYSGQCVSDSLSCNGANDCGDFSDESYCGFCDDNYFLCGDSCVGLSQVCDGTDDCDDGADELNCASCGDGSFACRSGGCIQGSLTCNGNDDCGDFSDEASCSSCNGGAFFCSPDAACLDPSWVCDAIEDCSDGADELSCF
ncbi:MAG: LDL receptor domain-containing protein [Deltaproteobacteria bacterium]